MYFANLCGVLGCGALVSSVVEDGKEESQDDEEKDSELEEDNEIDKDDYRWKQKVDHAKAVQNSKWSVKVRAQRYRECC